MNKPTLISISVFFLIGVLIGAQLRGCGGSGRPCTGTEIAHTKHDTITTYLPADTSWRMLSSRLPVAEELRPHHYDPDTAGIAIHAVVWSACDDTLTYADTIVRAALYKAMIRDTITANHIIGRSVWWADLRPTEQRTVTNTISVVRREPLLKAFIGADAVGGTHIDVAPAASLLVADRYLFDIGYYLSDRELMVGCRVKLGFLPRKR